jgi:leader peptidase (prepilin peptidase)/N-methyltransferase
MSFRSYDMEFFFWLISLGVFLGGLCVGSFLNVVIWRLPRGMSLMHPPSRCPRCGHWIRAWENIPLLSWLLLKGRCSGCHEPISSRYPLVELGNALLWLGLWLVFYWKLAPCAVLPRLMLLSTLLLALTLIDLDLRRLPDLLTVPGIAVALLSRLLVPDSFPAGLLPWSLLQRTSSLAGVQAPWAIGLLDSALGLLLALLFLALAYHLVRWSEAAGDAGKEILGGGDLKLAGMVGAFLGMDAVMPVLAMASLLACQWGISLMLLKRPCSSLPFAPFLGVAAWLWIMAGGVFWHGP